MIFHGKKTAALGAVLTALALLGGCAAGGLTAGSAQPVDQVPAAGIETSLSAQHHPEEPHAAAVFLASMGCVTENCADPAHYHNCAAGCTDPAHYHDCPAGCDDQSHAHSAHHGEQHHETAAFLASMGCMTENCTDPAHYHNCAAGCTDPAHYHDCPAGCDDQSHAHAAHHEEQHHGGHHQG